MSRQPHEFQLPVHSHLHYILHSAFILYNIHVPNPSPSPIVTLAR